MRLAAVQEQRGKPSPHLAIFDQATEVGPRNRYRCAAFCRSKTEKQEHAHAAQHQTHQRKPSTRLLRKLNSLDVLALRIGNNGLQFVG
jgi:hypothetical protein